MISKEAAASIREALTREGVGLNFDSLKEIVNIKDHIENDIRIKPHIGKMLSGPQTQVIVSATGLATNILSLCATGCDYDEALDKTVSLLEANKLDRAIVFYVAGVSADPSQNDLSPINAKVWVGAPHFLKPCIEKEKIIGIGLNGQTTPTFELRYKPNNSIVACFCYTDENYLTKPEDVDRSKYDTIAQEARTYLSILFDSIAISSVSSPRVITSFEIIMDKGYSYHGFGGLSYQMPSTDIFAPYEGSYELKSLKNAYAQRIKFFSNLVIGLAVSRLLRSRSEYDYTFRTLELGVALEALCLSSDPQTNETAHRFSLYGTLLRDIPNSERIDSVRKLKKMYALRSKVAHGGIIEQKDMPLVDEMDYIVVQILRNILRWGYIPDIPGLLLESNAFPQSISE